MCYVFVGGKLCSFGTQPGKTSCQRAKSEVARGEEDLRIGCMMEEALADSLGDVRKAAWYVWQFDENRLTPSRDYVIDPQSRTRCGRDDAARAPFFESISSRVWEKATFRSFKKLLDNYVATSGVPERVTQEEREEEDTFLEQVMDTKCMQFTFRWLCENGFDVGASSEQFVDKLRDLWFDMYDRGQDRDSSGFEHVFCGEIDDGRVKGLHNYVQVYVEEQRGNFDYMGYLNMRGERSSEAPPPNQQMMIIRFEWLKYLKSVSSMFVGTSPEFEVALYSLMWFAGAKGEQVQLGPYTVEIRMYDYDGKMTTAFPDLKDVDEEALAAEREARGEGDGEGDGEGEGEEEEEGDEEEGEEGGGAFDGSALHDSEEFPALG